MKTRPFFRLSPSLLLFLLLESCTLSRVPSQHHPVEPAQWMLDRLYFGRSIPGGGEVSEAHWRGFIDAEITPRFPDGLTVWRAEGQWRDSTGTLVRETSFLLELAHPNDTRSHRKVREIISEYKLRFRQESVLRITDWVHVEF